MASTPTPDNHVLKTPHSLSAAFTTHIDPDHRPKSSELLELYELLIKGQLEESLPQFDSLRKVKNAVNDHEGMSFFIRAFEEHPTLLHKLRVATGKLKGPSRRVKRRVKVPHVVSEPNLYPNTQKAQPQRKVSLDNLVTAPAATKEETEPKESSEYITLNDMFRNLVALLAGNAQVIIRITNQCLSLGVAYNNAMTNSYLTPNQRAAQLITSLLALIKSHSKPNDVFSSLIAVLQKVGLTLMANQLLEARKNHAQSGPNKQQQLRAAIKDTIPEVPNQSGLVPGLVVQLSSKDQVVKDIGHLYSQFTVLVSKLRLEFEELVKADRMKLNTLVRSAALYLHISISTLQTSSIEELLQDLELHYDFFNFNLLQHLANSHLSSLPIELTRYVDEVNKISELSQLRHIRMALHDNSSFQTSPTTSDRVVAIAVKLDCRWEEMTMKNFIQTLQYYFEPKIADLFSHVSFNKSSLFVTFFVPALLTKSLIEKVNDKRKSMSKLGILEIIIDKNEILISREEENNFNDFLHQSVKEGEMFQVSMLLLLGADLSSKDESGNSAIEIAIEAGHSQILKALLNTGAYDFTGQITKETENGDAKGVVESYISSIYLTQPLAEQCQEVITKLDSNHQEIYLKKSSPKMVELLVPFLLDFSSIKYISIISTTITRESIVAFFLQLSSNKTLETLSIINDSISDEGVIALSQSLRHNKKLNELYLYNNPGITSACAQPLAELLLSNQTLYYLYLYHINMDTSGILVLVQCLRINSTLRTLYLDKEYKQTCCSLSYYENIKERLFFM